MMSATENSLVSMTGRVTRFGALLLAFVVVSMAQQPQLKTRPIPPTNPADGEEMYLAYCASCHGPGGKGDGPVATVFKHKIPDLTRIRQRNRGLFPFGKVEATIAGDPNAPAHGTADMPVWGPLLADVSHQDRAQVQMRLYNLVEYVKSLQVQEQKAKK